MCPTLPLGKTVCVDVAQLVKTQKNNAALKILFMVVTCGFYIELRGATTLPSCVYSKISVYRKQCN